jgi:anti-anti-sigma factor
METQDGRHPARIDQSADGAPGRAPWVQELRYRSVLPEPFRILESTADGRRVIAPCGELDLATAAQLEERLAGNIATALDLSELSFIDSTGIRVLISTALRAQAEGWEFTVRSPQPAVLRVIKLVALEQELGLESQDGPASQSEGAATATRPGAAERHAAPLRTTLG